MAESGDKIVDHILPEATVLNTVQLTPARWAHGSYDDLVIQAGNIKK